MLLAQPSILGGTEPLVGHPASHLTGWTVSLRGPGIVPSLQTGELSPRGAGMPDTQLLVDQMRTARFSASVSLPMTIGLLTSWQPSVLCGPYLTARHWTDRICTPGEQARPRDPLLQCSPLDKHLLKQQSTRELCSVTQACPTRGGPVDCSPPASSVPGISQAGMLEWTVTPFSGGSSQPRDQTRTCCIDRWILYHLTTREAQLCATGANYGQDAKRQKVQLLRAESERRALRKPSAVSTSQGWAGPLSHPSGQLPGHTPTLTPHQEAARPPSGRERGDLFLFSHAAAAAGASVEPCPRVLSGLQSVSTYCGAKTPGTGVVQALHVDALNASLVAFLAGMSPLCGSCPPPSPASHRRPGQVPQGAVGAGPGAAGRRLDGGGHPPSRGLLSSEFPARE